MKQCFNFSIDNEWYTFKKDVENFLNITKLNKNLKIWCPFDKADSAFVKTLKQYGYDVVYSHIDEGYDFYNLDLKQFNNIDIIISNPPFKNKANIIKRIKEINKPFALIFGIQCFNSGSFTRELSELNDLQLIFLTKRMKFHKGTENDKLPQPTFHSIWLCNNISNLKTISIYDEKNNLKN